MLRWSPGGGLPCCLGSLAEWLILNPELSWTLIGDYSSVYSRAP